MAGGNEPVEGGMQPAIRLMLPGETRSRCAVMPGCGHGCEWETAAHPVLRCLSPSLTSSSSRKGGGQRGNPTRGIVLGRVPDLGVGGRGPMRGCGHHPGKGRLLQSLCHDIPPTSPLPHPFLLPLSPLHPAG